MKLSIKAALLSALIIPGAGHVFLKKYSMAVILISATSVALLLLVKQIIEKILMIKNELIDAVIAQNIQAIVDLITGLLNSLNSTFSYVLIFCWVLGLIDAYRLGKRQEKYNG